MKKFLDSFSRFFVGSLFIFSGLIKLNDPVGTKIKLEEYFDVFARDIGPFFHYFIPFSLEIGLVLIILEIVLGVALLVCYRMRVTTWVLLGLMLFFLFLTFYSAYFNKVTDCGCFGDAIKLTPWESFWKDIVLIVFVLHLFWYRRKYVATLRTREGHAAVVLTAVVSLSLGLYAIHHLPFIDFRAYKVGNSIPAQMRAPEQPILEYRFTKNGVETRSTQYLPAAEGYRYVSSRILNEDRIKPKITDYAVTSPEGEDITQATFKGAQLLIVIENVAGASTRNFGALRTLTRALDGKVDCLVLTASPEDQIESFRHEHQLAVPYAFADATVLKTMIRANPGIALWKDGVVLGNWHYNDTPTAEEILHLLQ